LPPLFACHSERSEEPLYFALAVAVAVAVVLAAAVALAVVLALAVAVALPIAFLTHPKNRHFDRSCSRFCEQRSGEIRFSTQQHPSHCPSLPLSLPVSAVILSAAKDPEEVHSPQPVEPFNPISTAAPLLPPNPGNGFRSAEARRKADGEATNLLTFHLFFAFSAQKTHVKPQKHLKQTESSTYAWRIYPLQPAIIKVSLENNETPFFLI
jgi:hypothetical protein